MVPVYVDNISTAVNAIWAAFQEYWEAGNDPMSEHWTCKEQKDAAILGTLISAYVNARCSKITGMTCVISTSDNIITGSSMPGMSREDNKKLLWNGLALWDMTVWHDNFKPSN